MRLIDADAFSDEMRKRQNSAYILMNHSMKGSELNIRMESAHVTFTECKLALDSMPTIDAVPVVRCGDCKHYLDEDQKGCGLTYSIIKPNDYCSYGERKDDDE